MNGSNPTSLTPQALREGNRMAMTAGLKSELDLKSELEMISRVLDKTFPPLDGELDSEMRALLRLLGEKH